MTTQPISAMDISSAGARQHFEKRSINVPAHKSPGVGVKPSSDLVLYTSTADPSPRTATSSDDVRCDQGMARVMHKAHDATHTHQR